MRWIGGKADSAMGWTVTYELQRRWQQRYSKKNDERVANRWWRWIGCVCCREWEKWWGCVCIGVRWGKRDGHVCRCEMESKAVMGGMCVLVWERWSERWWGHEGVCVLVWNGEWGREGRCVGVRELVSVGVSCCDLWGRRTDRFLGSVLNRIEHKPISLLIFDSFGCCSSNQIEQN